MPTTLRHLRIEHASLSNSVIRATFKGANGNSLGSQVSGAAFGTSRSPGAPPTTSHGLAAVKHDLDGDSKTELTVFRPTNGTWYVRYSSLGYSLAGYDQVQWGLPGDIPIAGDFDGDGKTELAVWRPSNGTWYVRYSSLGYSLGGYNEFQWGLPGDRLVK